jgi:hypothetical protein
MNCKHVQELLPLYVGRDLEEKRVKLIASHLQSCAECAGSANEYQESRQLLQRFAPPLFSEAVYTGIRQRVLREIERESNVPSLRQLIAGVLRPRLKLAVATSLMLAVSVLAFYFIANRTNDQHQVAESRDAVERKIGDEEPKKGPQRQQTSTLSSSKKKDDPARQPQRRKNSELNTNRTRSVAVNTPDTQSLTTEGSPKGNDVPAPDAVSGGNQVSPEKTLRVEIQTKDPNIRIIWFSHPRTQQGSQTFQGI